MRENVSLCGFPVFTRIVPDVNLLTSKRVEKITILDRCSSASMTLQCFCLRKGIPRRCLDQGPVAVGRYSQSSKHVSVALTPRSPGLPAVRQAKKRWRRYVCPATFETIVQHFFFFLESKIVLIIYHKKKRQLPPKKYLLNIWNVLM